MQMVFHDVPCEFLLRNGWRGLDYEKLKLQVHNDPTIEEYMNPLLNRDNLSPRSTKRVKTTRTKDEEVQMLRDAMQGKLWASLEQNNRPPQPGQSEDDDQSSTTTSTSS